MLTDEEDRKRGAKARHTPLKGTRYTDPELNARVREFPPASEIWNIDRTEPVLLNPKQVLDVIPVDAKKEGFRLRKSHVFLTDMNGKVIDPVVATLRTHLLIRKYKAHVTVNRLKFLADGDRVREHLSGWHLSSHEERRSVALLSALYGSGAVQFRDHACEVYRTKFGDWLSSGTASRRGRRSISSNAELLERFSLECAFIEVLRRAFGDAESASSEWPSILSGKHVPSLNRLHRIVNPKKDGVDWMDDNEMFVTSIIMSLFGCTNAALVYPKLLGFEGVFHVLCFFGRVNLGEIWPTGREAEAFLRYCDVGCDETVPAEVRSIVAMADRLLGWKKFRVDLAKMCRETIEANDAGTPLPCRFGRLWPMV